MPNSEDHFQQACRNLTFLDEINKGCYPSCDWHVTVAFYVSVNLINSHLAKFNMHYRSHEDVSNAINPYQTLSPTKLPEDIYLAYKKLQGLSRRSRYLVHEEPSNKSETCHITYDKHFVKAIKKVDILLDFFAKNHSTPLPATEIKCIGLKLGDLKHIKVII